MNGNNNDLTIPEIGVAPDGTADLTGRAQPKLSPRGDKPRPMTTEELAADIVTVRRWEQARLPAWAALAHIYDREGFRPDFKNFDEFCVNTFGWGKSTGSRYVRAYKYVMDFPDLHQLDERHVREFRLAELPQPDAVDILKSQPALPSVKELEHLVANTQGHQTWMELEALAGQLDIQTQAQLDENYWIEPADLQEFLPQLQPQSIDCALIDVPYERKNLKLIPILANKLKTVLKPTGSVAIMVGTDTLVETLNAFHLEIPYRCELTYLLPPGECSRVRSKQVDPDHKSVFVFGAVNPDEWINRTQIQSEPIDKAIKKFHRYAQCPIGFRRILEKIVRRTPANPHPVVLDCCVGAGATPLACYWLNLRFIGCDVVPKFAAFSKTRVSAEHAKKIKQTTAPAGTNQ